MAELVAVRGLERTGNAFRAELSRVAERLEADPNALAAVMSFETGGTFDPAIRNPSSSATGLIQFMSSTAANLGTTTAALARMSDVEQLAYVERYLAPVKGRLKSVADHYMAVFAPIGIGRAPSFALYKGEGNAAYERNKGLDQDKDHVITVAEAAMPVQAILNAGEKRPRLAVDMSGAPSPPPGGGAVQLGDLASKVTPTLSGWWPTALRVGILGALALAALAVARASESSLSTAPERARRKVKAV